MNKRVEGTYASVSEAMNAVDRLRDQGFSRNSIHVVANDEVRNSIPFMFDADVTSEESVRNDITDDDRSLWDKIKDAFTVGDYEDSRYDAPDYDADRDPLAQYREDLRSGKIVILVDDDDDTTTREGTLGGVTTPADPAISEGITGPTDQAFGTDSNSDLEEDVKATDPPLLADMQTEAPLPNTQMEDFTTNDMRTEPPSSRDTVNDVNVPLQEELDLADAERESGTPHPPHTDGITEEDAAPAEPGMPSDSDRDLNQK